MDSFNCFHISYFEETHALMESAYKRVVFLKKKKKLILTKDLS